MDNNLEVLEDDKKQKEKTSIRTSKEELRAWARLLYDIYQNKKHSLTKLENNVK